MTDKKEVTYAEIKEAEEDRQLIRRIKQGYQPAFTQLVSRYQQPIFKMAYGFFQDKDDAMEVVQETFIRLYRKLDGFDENDVRTKFRNWLYRMAHNICIDFYRKFKKQKVSMKEIYEFDEEYRSLPAKPEEEHERKRFRDDLQASVKLLPRRQRSVFVMRHFNGMKHQEISEMLNLSVGTIKSLYHRAIQSLKKHLVGSNLEAI